jgi:hypothetical protein
VSGELQQQLILGGLLARNLGEVSTSTSGREAVLSSVAGRWGAGVGSPAARIISGLSKWLTSEGARTRFAWHLGRKLETPELSERAPHERTCHWIWHVIDIDRSRATGKADFGRTLRRQVRSGPVRDCAL